MTNKANFSDHKTAMAMRDVIRSIAKKVVDRERPRPRYGTLVSIDSHGHAEVQFPRESGTVTVNTGMLAPTSVGCLVRVDRIGNDRYLTDAYGVLLSAESPSLTMLDLNIWGFGVVVSQMVSSPVAGPANVLNDFTTGQWPAFTISVGSGLSGLLINEFQGANNNSATSTMHLTERINKPDTTLLAGGVLNGPGDARAVSLGAGLASVDQKLSIRPVTFTVPGIHTVTAQFQYSSGAPSATTPAAGPFFQSASITYIPIP